MLTAVGYLVSGAGFGMLVPALTHLGMRDVPPGVSGAASGIFNACRQIGTSVGLAVLGSIGAAQTSFVHGFHLAVGVGAACLFVASCVAAVGFGRRAAEPELGMEVWTTSTR